MKKLMTLIAAIMFATTIMASQINVECKIVDRIDSTLIANNVSYCFSQDNCYATLKFLFHGSVSPFVFNVYEKITKGKTTYLIGKGTNNINIIRIKNGIIYIPINNSRMLVVRDESFAEKINKIIEPIEESDKF